MVLTGRAALLALVGAGVVGLLVAGGVTPWQALVAVNAVLLLVLVLDAVSASTPRNLVLARSGDRKVRLGQVANVQLAVTNTGRRRWRGYLRDAWAPTAHATIDGVSDRAALDLPAGDTVRIDVAVQPSRRGDRPTDRVTLRSLGPFGLAGRQRSVEVDWSVRTLPPFSSRRHLPSRLARLRDMDGRQAIAVRAPGHRVRLAARVRPRRRRALHRLAGHRARRRRDGAHLAPRARPSGRDGPGHRAHQRGPHRG